MKQLHRQTYGDLVHYQFDSLNKAGVVHSVSTRHGGASPAPFDSLNLSPNVGDTATNVKANLLRWHVAIGLDPVHTVSAGQAQADRVAIVSAQHRGTRVPNVDALLTNARGVPLMLRYADCVPILLYDPKRHCAGVVHAGWRGTVAKVVTNAAMGMCRAFGGHPRDLVACIGPSIGPCCYCVGEDVAERAQSAFEDEESILADRDGKTFFDLWQANAGQLSMLGVEQIEIASICTACHTDEFFSARAEKTTGRFGALIALA